MVMMMMMMMMILQYNLTQLCMCIYVCGRHGYSVSSSSHQLMSFNGHKKSCRRVRFNTDGSQLVTASKDKSIQVIDMAAGSVATKIQDAHEYVYPLCHTVIVLVLPVLLDCCYCWWSTFGGFPHEVLMPNNQDLLARSHQELRGHIAHRSRSGGGSHHTPPELRLRSHCQAFWRHAGPPNTPVSCRSDSRPSSWPKLEASPRSSQQQMDWPAMQGQQQHATSWPVEKIHHTWSIGSDATVLDDYALTTMTTYCY